MVAEKQWWRGPPRAAGSSPYAALRLERSPRGAARGRTQHLARLGALHLPVSPGPPPAPNGAGEGSESARTGRTRGPPKVSP